MEGTPEVPAPEAAVPATAPAAPGPASLREDQIASAVAFLSHPKVRSSPESTKRSFLERKGLTQEEIDEAFKRAPPQEAAPAPPATPAASTPTAAAAPQPQPLVTYAQPQQPQQQQPYGPMQQQLQPYGGPMQPHMMQPPPPEPIRWTQVLLGLSVVGGAAFAAVHYVAPTVVGWYRALSESREKQRRAAAERDEALAAALEAMAATQQRLATAVEELASAVGRGDGGPGAGAAAAARSPGYGGAQASGAQGGALGWDGDAPTYSPASSSRRPRGPQYAEDPYSTLSAAADGRPAALGGSSRSSPRRGARFGGGVPPSPPASVSASAPTPVPPSRGANGSSGALGLAAASATQQPFQQQPYQQQQQQQQQQQASRPDDAPHSQAFLDIMAMVARGETPPNVRTDINDAPPDPTRAPSQPQLRPKPKPWEAAAGGGGAAAADAASGATKPWGDSAAGYAAGDAGWAARNPAVGGGFGGSPGPGSAGSGRPAHTDLSALLGGHDARDAPWRPPPPPAPTVAAKPAGVADEAAPVAVAAAAAVPEAVVNGVAVADFGGEGEDAAREAAARVAAAAVQAVMVGAEAPAY